jgi:hypothetical protein
VGGVRFECAVGGVRQQRLTCITPESVNTV